MAQGAKPSLSTALLLTLSLVFIMVRGTDALRPRGPRGAAEAATDALRPRGPREAAEAAPDALRPRGAATDALRPREAAEAAPDALRPRGPREAATDARVKRSDDTAPLQAVVEQQAAVIQSLLAKVSALQADTAALKSRQLAGKHAFPKQRFYPSQAYTAR